MLVPLLLLYASACLTTVYSVDSTKSGGKVNIKSETHSKPEKVETNWQIKIDALSNKFVDFESRLQSKIDNIDDSTKNKLANIEQASNDLSKKLSGIDESLKKQETTTQNEKKQVGSRLDQFDANLKQVKTSVQGFDLSQYVPLQDFNNLQKDYDSLKSKIGKIETQHENHKSQLSKMNEMAQQSELMKMKQDLKQFQTTFESSHSKTREETGQNVVALEKEVASLKLLLEKTRQELLDTVASKTKSSDSGTTNKLKQLEKQFSQLNTKNSQMLDNFDGIRDELVGLEDKVHSVETKTIGAMIENSVKTSKLLLNKGMKFGKEKGEILMEMSEKYGKNLMETGTAKGSQLIEASREKFADLKVKVGNYDYSWMTDEENWRLLGNYFNNMFVICKQYTREQVIPAIQTQSTQMFTNIQEFCVDFYQNRRNLFVYEQMSNTLLPLFEQVEQFPKEYYDLALDIIMASLAIIGLIISQGVLLLFCNCLCPRKSKVVDDDVDVGDRNSGLNGNQVSSSSSGSGSGSGSGSKRRHRGRSGKKDKQKGGNAKTPPQ